MRELRLFAALLLLTLLVAAASASGQDMQKCPQCGYENPVKNKFCNKCGTAMAKTEAYFLGPGAKGRISQVEKGRVIINAGTSDGIHQGDYFHTFEVTEIVTSPSTGDTLDYRSSINAIIKITEASHHASYGSYRVVGSTAPVVGNEIYPHHRGLNEKNWFISVAVGSSTPKEPFPIGQKEWPDWNWADLSKTSPPDWGGEGAVSVEIEFAINNRLSLGANLSVLSYGSLRPNWMVFSPGGFAKLYQHFGRFSLYGKTLYGKYSGEYKVEIWFTDQNPHYPETYSSDYSGTIFEYGGGLRFAATSVLGLFVEYSKGKMTLEDVAAEEFNGYIIPIFCDDSAEFDLIQFGLNLGF